MLLYNLRRWMKEAPAGEVRAAGIAIAVVAALVAWSLVPSGDSGGAASDVATTNTATANIGTTNIGTTDVGAAGSLPNSASGAADATVAAPGGEASSGATSTGGTAAAGPGDASGAAGGAGSASEPGGTASAGQTGPLTASDVGVTETTIKIGYVPFPQDVAAAIGAPFNFREDEEEVVAAYLDEINKAGGVLGRKLEVVYRPLVGFEANTMRAMCLQFTQEDRVFAVLQQYGGADPACLFEYKTPFITATPGTIEDQRNFFPYSISTQSHYTQSGKDMVYGLRDQGFFDTAKGFVKLGLVTEACMDSFWNHPQHGVKAYLKQIGVTEWSEYRVDCSIEALNSAHTPAILQHRQAGVTHVIISAQPTDRNYTQSAEQQGYRPKYGWGDFHWATHDANAASFNLDAMDGAIGVTQFHHVHPLEVPEVQRCNKIITDHGLPPVESWETDLLVLNACEHLRLFVEAATRAGPDLKRANLGLAVQQLGDFPTAVEHSARFGQGKLTGGDTIQFIVFRKACRCWQPAGDWRPSYYDG